MLDAKEIELYRDVDDRYSGEEKIKVLVPNSDISKMSELVSNIMNDIQEDGELMKYEIIKYPVDSESTELAVKCVFNSYYITVIHDCIMSEIEQNTAMIDRLSLSESITPVIRRIFDNRIDDLLERNDKLLKQSNIIKMQLLNEMNKEQNLLNKLSLAVMESDVDCHICWTEPSSQIQEAILQLNCV